MATPLRGPGWIFEWNPNHACDLGTAFGSSPLPLFTCSASSVGVILFGISCLLCLHCSINGVLCQPPLVIFWSTSVDKPASIETRIHCFKIISKHRGKLPAITANWYEGNGFSYGFKIFLSHSILFR